MQDDKENDISNILQIVESNDASPFIKNLFQKKFRLDPPKSPRNFIAMYSNDGINWMPVGYIHYSIYKDSFLAGGFVVDEKGYKIMPAEHRKLMKSNGGIAGHLLVKSIELLGDYKSIWAHVGNKLSAKILSKSNFIPIDEEYFMVLWGKKRLYEYQKKKITKEILNLEPF